PCSFPWSSRCHSPGDAYGLSLPSSRDAPITRACLSPETKGVRVRGAVSLRRLSRPHPFQGWNAGSIPAGATEVHFGPMTEPRIVRFEYQMPRQRQRASWDSMPTVVATFDDGVTRRNRSAHEP